jgi:hypothetical protein
MNRCSGSKRVRLVGLDLHADDIAIAVAEHPARAARSGRHPRLRAPAHADDVIALERLLFPDERLRRPVPPVV